MVSHTDIRLIPAKQFVSSFEHVLQSFEKDLTLNPNIKYVIPIYMNKYTEEVKAIDELELSKFSDTQLDTLLKNSRISCLNFLSQKYTETVDNICLLDPFIVNKNTGRVSQIQDNLITNLTLKDELLSILQ